MIAIASYLLERTAGALRGAAIALDLVREYLGVREDAAKRARANGSGQARTIRVRRPS